jgi:hypothetical protein
MQKTRARLVVGLVAAVAALSLSDAPAPAKSAGSHHRATHREKHRHARHCKRRPGKRCRAHARSHSHARATAERHSPSRRSAVEPPVTQPPAIAPTVFDRPFAASSFWNAPLSPTAALDPYSTSLVTDLRRQVDRDLALRHGPWINTTFYSTPIYRVPASQPTVHVTLDQWNPALQAAFDAVPIPPGARAAAGTDANMVVWQPATDTMWEFWLMRQAADGWHAKWGGRMTSVSTNPGRYDNNWGAPATSLPQIGGTITLAELRAGRIDHALAMAVPEPRRGVFVWPARRTDGISASPQAIPEGTRFRLDPAVNLDSLALPRPTRILAEAAQRYGMVVRDKSANVTLYAEDPTPTGTDPYPALFDGLPPNKILQAFPWNRLVALAPAAP